MANLTLRTLTRAGDITKNAPLTNTEVDTNFINLDEDISQINLRIDGLPSEFQEPLVSGVNIKTINGQSILGSGDVNLKTIEGAALVGTGNIVVDVAAKVHAAAAKTTPVDADELGLADSAGSWALKKLTFANLKAWIGGFFVSKSGDTMTGALNWAPSVGVASAASTNIGAAASNRVRITGTTTITRLGSIAAGACRTVTFAGALTLTHNATSLILPGGANITTAAGDVAEFESLGGGNWRCTSYLRANGQAVSVSPLPNTITKTVTNPGTTSFTAVPGNHYLIRSVVTSTLPASPTVGDTIYFTSYIAGWTVARNGNVISGVAENLVVDIGGPGNAMRTFGLRFIEAGTNVGWVII